MKRALQYLSLYRQKLRPRRVRAIAAAIAITLVLGAGLAAYKLQGYLSSKHLFKTQTVAGKTEAPSDAQARSGKGKERKVLYYRNPMGQPDTSPVPKKDEMGMDYVPVYENDEEEKEKEKETVAGQVAISKEKVQKLGVVTEAADMRDMVRSINAPGKIQANEGRIQMVAPRFEGWIDRLHVSASGQRVRAGQVLLDVYSPQLNAAQQEYVAARALHRRRRKGDAETLRLAQAALERLRNLGLDERDIAALRRTGKVKRTVAVRSPVEGIVTEKKAVSGMRFMRGDTLYQITNLSNVWVMADVFEQDIGAIKAGQEATVRLNAYPGQEFPATVDYVYPTVNEQTRATPVRLVMRNAKLLFKPGMYADVALLAGESKAAVLTIPVSAVIDSGTRQTVLVARSEGRYEPRQVKLGARNDRYVRVLEGVSEKEQVVVSANFLLDSESNLRSAIAGFGKQSAPSSTETRVAKKGKAVKHKAVATHHAQGVITNVDEGSNTLTITHEPVASLKWPAMTMDFRSQASIATAGLRPGAKITFDFQESEPGEYLITSLSADKGSPAAPASGQGH